MGMNLIKTLHYISFLLNYLSLNCTVERLQKEHSHKKKVAQATGFSYVIYAVPKVSSYGRLDGTVLLLRSKLTG